MAHRPLAPARRRARTARRIPRRAVLLGLILAGALALPTAVQALSVVPAAVAVRADSAPQPIPAPGVSPAPGPVPSPQPGPSPNPTPGPGSGSGSAGSGSSKGGGSGRLPAPQPLPSPPTPSPSGPSWWDIPGQVEHAIDQWFGDLVKAALTPIMNLIGRTVLSNPDTTGGRTGQLWQAALVIANTCYVLFAVVGGVIVMTHETVQTRYALGQIAPRLVLGLIAANTSLLVIGKAIAFANALTQAIWGQPLDPAGIGNKLLGTILDSIFLPDGVNQIFMVLFGLVLAVLAGAVLFSAALRTAALMLLTFAAPLALSCHALPGLDAIAKLWWRCFAAVFAIQILQALTLILALQTFFDPDGDVLGVPTSAGFTDLLVCGALFVILLKIPGWVLRVALGRQPRTGAMGMLKTAAAAAIGTAIGVPGVTSARTLAGRVTGRALRGHLGPGGAGGANPTGGTGPRTPGGPRPPHPSRPGAPAPRTGRANFGAARGRPTRGGQLPLFPLPPGARRQPAGAGTFAATGSGSPSAAPSSGSPAAGGAMPSPMPGPVQPALFPATSPGPVGRGRQMPLFPIPPGARVPRNPTPGAAPSAGTPAPAPARRAQSHPRPDASRSRRGAGATVTHYPPIILRAPTSAAAPEPAPARAAARRYQQLALFPRTAPQPPAAANPATATGRAPRTQAPPAASPRTVPVRLPAPAAMKAAKKMTPTRRTRKGGD
jgi:hypothetical protein